MVGVNKYATNSTHPLPLVDIDEKVSEEQIKRLKDVRRKRDNKAVKNHSTISEAPAKRR